MYIVGCHTVDMETVLKTGSMLSYKNRLNELRAFFISPVVKASNIQSILELESLHRNLACVPGQPNCF